MNIKALILLAACFLGLYTYIHFAIEKPFEAEQEQKEQDSRVASFEAEDLISLKIDHAHRDDIEIGQERGFWYVKSPFHDLARQSQLDRLFSAFQNARIEKVLFTEENWPENLVSFGLDEKHRTSLEWTTMDGRSQIFLGHRNPSSEFTYVHLSDPRRLALISNDFEFIETDQPDDFREMKLVNTDTEKIVEFEVSKKSRARTIESFRLKKNKAREWELSEPKRLPLDQDKVNSLVRKLGVLRASTFYEELPKVLRTPTLEIKALFAEGVRDPRSTAQDQLPAGILIEMAREKKEGVSEPGPDDFRYFAISDKTQAAQVARFHYENFDLSYKDLIRTDFRFFSTEDILSLKVESEEENFEVVLQKDGAFLKEGDQLIPAQKEAVERAILHIRQLSASRLEKPIEDSKFELKNSFRVTLKTREGASFGFDLQASEDESQMLFESLSFGRLLYWLRPKSFEAELFKKELFLKSSASDS